MKISTKGRYALRLMIDLAKNGGDGFLRLNEISERQEISVKYLEQIIIPLCKAKLLKSGRGAHGGYKLARSPEKYTVKDILQVTEISLAPVSCLEGPKNTCPRRKTCATLKFWEGLRKTTDSYLKSTTLADLSK